MTAVRSSVCRGYLSYCRKRDLKRLVCMKSVQYRMLKRKNEKKEAMAMTMLVMRQRREVIVAEGRGAVVRLLEGGFSISNGFWLAANYYFSVDASTQTGRKGRQWHGFLFPSQLDQVYASLYYG